MSLEGLADEDLPVKYTPVPFNRPDRDSKLEEFERLNRSIKKRKVVINELLDGLGINRI
jgi:hypothetical protein